MRTTLNLEDDLLRRAKSEAATRGVTLTRVIEEALRAELAPKPVRDGFRLQMPVVSGRRAPDVDVADRDALYDVMEERAPRAWSPSTPTS